jgi:hypothetical protein
MFVYVKRESGRQDVDHDQDAHGDKDIDKDQHTGIDQDIDVDENVHDDVQANNDSVEEAG